MTHTEFALDPDELKVLLERLETANDRLTEASADTDLLLASRSPAGDPASEAYTARLGMLFASDRDHLRRRIAFLRELVAKVGTSAGRLREQDATAAGDLAG
ncbi:hypothetical protein [Amycolatopsis lexingtonensis]|uniref:hypothetical protein n=1 Tax=Amycolatopsis lexingtonensis TaxID=218822 RepID=UPI003F722DB6